MFFKEYLILGSLLLCLFVTISSSKSFEFETVRTKSVRRVLVSKNSGRMLADKDIIVQHEENQDYFIINLGIGTPAQFFPVQIDTTTSITWVPSVDCENCNATKRFNSSASSTSRVENKTIEIEDEDGDVKGLITYDRVEFEQLEVPEMGFVQVNKYDDDFTDYAQGKLGLGYRTEHGHKFSILEALKQFGAIDKKIFALSEKDATHGRLHIGDYPKEFSRSSEGYSFCNLTQVDDLDDDFRDSWVCEISHVLIGPAQNFTDAYVVNGRAIFDSGYSYISVPKSLNSFFRIAYINSQDRLNCTEATQDDEIVFTCSLNNGTLDDLDQLHFLFDGYAYTINPNDLFKSTGNSAYELLIRFSDDRDNIWTFGHPFLSQYTTVFNAEENHVGFFGGYKVNFSNDWSAWYNGSYGRKADQVFYLIVGASILGALLLILVLFIIIHSIKRRRLEEHGPLIDDSSR